MPIRPLCPLVAALAFGAAVPTARAAEPSPTGGAIGWGAFGSVAPRPAVPDTSPPPPRLVASDAPMPKISEGDVGLGVGLTTFGVVYMFTSLGGALAIDDANSGYDPPVAARRRNYGRALLVPVVGPFVAAAFTDSAAQRWGVFVSGTAQLAGVVVAAVGVVQKVRARRAHRLSVGAGMASGGATLTLGGRF